MEKDRAVTLFRPNSLSRATDCALKVPKDVSVGICRLTEGKIFSVLSYLPYIYPVSVQLFVVYLTLGQVELEKPEDFLRSLEAVLQALQQLQAEVIIGIPFFCSKHALMTHFNLRKQIIALYQRYDLRDLLLVGRAYCPCSPDYELTSHDLEQGRSSLQMCLKTFFRHNDCDSIRKPIFRQMVPVFKSVKLIIPPILLTSKQVQKIPIGIEPRLYIKPTGEEFMRHKVGTRRVYADQATQTDLVCPEMATETDEPPTKKARLVVPHYNSDATATDTSGDEAYSSDETVPLLTFTK
jgi:hypothetical protein